MISGWDNKTYTALSNIKISPKYCDTQKLIIRNHYPSGYEDLYSLINTNHTNNLNHPIYLIAAPPTQLKARDLLSKYLHRYKDYLERRAYLKNDYYTLNDSYESLRV